jgi:hypothetical protein
MSRRFYHVSSLLIPRPVCPVSSPASLLPAAVPQAAAAWWHAGVARAAVAAPGSSLPLLQLALAANWLCGSRCARRLRLLSPLWQLLLMWRPTAVYQR